jgi:CheY-like chemotaxis protein
MDASTLLIAGTAFIGSSIAQKCADAAISAAWDKLVSFFGPSPGPQDFVGDDLHSEKADGRELLLAQAEVALAQSSALRRAEVVASVLNGARILWVDDNPGNNEWEVALLGAFGVQVSQLLDTEQAVTWLAENEAHLVLSDIARGSSPQAGIEGLSQIATASGGIPVIFYTGFIGERPVPRGAFGMADRPNELLHLVLDVFERVRF